MKKNPNHPAALAAALLAGLAAPAHAIGCDELRETIDARIRAGGVSSFSLTVVAAGESAPGAVVGTCDRGARKIHYVKGQAGAVATAPAPAAKPVASPAPATAPAPKPKAAAPEVITECDDGSSVTHGECKK